MQESLEKVLIPEIEKRRVRLQLLPNAPSHHLHHLFHHLLVSSGDAE